MNFIRVKNHLININSICTSKLIKLEFNENLNYYTITIFLKKKKQQQSEKKIILNFCKKRRADQALKKIYLALKKNNSVTRIM